MATAPAATAGATTAAPPLAPPAKHSVHEKLSKKPSKIGMTIFIGVMIAGLIYIGSSIARDMSGTQLTAVWPYVLLGQALLVALGFEFVNGFHDTANAVATVIYTHSLDPQIAVVWSGFWNFAGVVTSTGAVAFGIVSLLPVELILQVGSGAGFAMVFALLTAAILWNLGTWWLGLPASSSHTLIGSIIGVGIANQLMNARSGTSGVDWAGQQNRSVAPDVSCLWLCSGRHTLHAFESRRKGKETLRSARRHRAAPILDSRPAHPHLHRRQLLPRLQ
jgi:inorganic phosphate transporter, PiT family